MKRSIMLVLGALTILLNANSSFAAPEECQKLQQQLELIYAAKGYCLKDPDPEVKARYDSSDCFTDKPKFTAAEQTRVDQIKARQKVLQCQPKEL